MANLHRKFNHLSFLVVDGGRYKVFQDMKSAIPDLYKSLFTEPEPWTPKVDGLPLPPLRDFDKDYIEQRLSSRRKLLKHYLIVVGINPVVTMA